MGLRGPLRELALSRPIGRHILTHYWQLYMLYDILIGSPTCPLNHPWIKGGV